MTAESHLVRSGLQSRKLRFYAIVDISQPVGEVVEQINPILRGWVNYFRVGNSGHCFSVIKAWVEKKIRRHLMRARNHQGYGWKRWSKAWLYGPLGLFNDYQVRYSSQV